MPATRQTPNSPHVSIDVLRKDLLRMALRDTLAKCGIPAAWLAGETLTAVAPDGGRGGLHLRLLMRHWDPRLVINAVALETRVRKAVLAIDPKAAEWFYGMSWQFDLPANTVFPPMPLPTEWVPPVADSTRARLSRMLEERDEEFQQHQHHDNAYGFSHTMPGFTPTAPMPLPMSQSAAQHL